MRQQSILASVVDTYIETAQPVGSRFITEQYARVSQSSYSPATVRHEMGILEKKGYLTHPHTSAGRMPTDQGYRYYVDHSLKKESLDQEDFGELAEQFEHSSEEFESMGEKISQKMAMLSSQVCLFVVQVPSSSPQLDRPKKFRVFLQGSSQILEKPEFQDLTKVKKLFKTLEERTHLGKWLLGRADQQTAITIGTENQREAFKECTVISSGTRIGSKSTGALALLGPKRMRYSRMIPLVENMTLVLERALRKFSKESWDELRKKRS